MGYGEKSKKEKAADANKAKEAAAKGAQEDASWQDNDKATNKTKKVAGKEEADAERARLKAEKQALEQEEAASMAASSKKKTKDKSDGKLTQAQIQRNLAMLAMGPQLGKKNSKTKKTVGVDAPKLEENKNRVSDIEATGVEEAIKALDLDKGAAGGSDEKYTFKKFEQEFMADCQAENPGLKRQQLNEKLWKMWERSQLNPKNQKD